MTNTLDDLTSNSISLAYAGKNLAGYLNITVPKISPELEREIEKMNKEGIGYRVCFGVLRGIAKVSEKLYSLRLLLFDKREYEREKEAIEQERKRSDKIDEDVRRLDKNFTEELRSAGIVTPQEREAYMIAYQAGLCIDSCVRSAGERCFRGIDENNQVKIIGRNHGIINEIRVTTELFEKYLRMGINIGVSYLESRHWTDIPNVPRPEIVNPDFEEKAMKWLIDEVHSRTYDGKECIFLEKVIAKKERDGWFCLKSYREAE